MALTDKQKKIILKKKDKFSAEELASELKLDVKAVEEFIQTPIKKVPRWFYIVLILIPIIIILLLEVGLRIFSYGRIYDQWIPIGNGKLSLNPEIAHRYFYSSERVPSAGYNYFDEIKKENSFRVFVLGGSSAAGFPYTPNGSFARYIQKRLQLVYTEKTIEVVNIAMSAINSYALRDMLPGVLDKHPDLIIIYAGHNEYYGALGVGSVETLGDTRFIVNTVIWLNRFKTFKLLRNVIKGASGLFSKPVKLEGTLMARMSQRQLIPFDSEKYYAGISQFEGNLRDMLKMAYDKNVQIVLGTLVSNLKEQKPFESVEDEKYPRADDIFTSAQEELAKGKSTMADSLFRYAKDLDALRWRAPEKFNSVIELLGKEFKYPVVKLDSVFDVETPDGVVGDNLITDHLHPNLRGYQIIGRELFNKCFEANLFPNERNTNYSLAVQDSITLSRYEFTKFDSTIALYQIIILKSDWPYTKKKISDEEKLKALNMKTYADTLAYLVGKGDIPWETAHLQLAQRKLSEGDIESFKKEIIVAADEYPFDPYLYKFAAQQLIDTKNYDDAYAYLLKLNNIKKNAYSTKWLGIIDLLNNKVDSAMMYLSESLNYNSSDATVLYNLAGAYSLKKDYQTALQMV
ncbi:MAG: GDSL-type esterase/lipase family protein, partial [Ignavibacteriaceae bacterium]|nr:GDSL-type esterase/lipase family protein [Ignavibacteriaceae bacterium]